MLKRFSYTQKKNSLENELYFTQLIQSITLMENTHSITQKLIFENPDFIAEISEPNSHKSSPLKDYLNQAVEKGEMEEKDLKKIKKLFEPKNYFNSKQYSNFVFIGVDKNQEKRDQEQLNILEQLKFNLKYFIQHKEKITTSYVLTEENESTFSRVPLLKLWYYMNFLDSVLGFFPQFHCAEETFKKNLSEDVKEELKVISLLMSELSYSILGVITTFLSLKKWIKEAKKQYNTWKLQLNIQSANQIKLNHHEKNEASKTKISQQTLNEGWELYRQLIKEIEKQDLNSFLEHFPKSIQCPVFEKNPWFISFVLNGSLDEKEKDQLREQISATLRPTVATLQLENGISISSEKNSMFKSNLKPQNNFLILFSSTENNCFAELFVDPYVCLPENIYDYPSLLRRYIFNINKEEKYSGHDLLQFSTLIEKHQNFYGKSKKTTKEEDIRLVGEYLSLKIILSSLDISNLESSERLGLLELLLNFKDVKINNENESIPFFTQKQTEFISDDSLFFRLLNLDKIIKLSRSIKSKRLENYIDNTLKIITETLKNLERMETWVDNFFQNKCDLIIEEDKQILSNITPIIKTKIGVYFSIIICHEILLVISSKKSKTIETPEDKIILQEIIDSVFKLQNQCRFFYFSKRDFTLRLALLFIEEFSNNLPKIPIIKIGRNVNSSENLNIEFSYFFPETFSVIDFKKLSSLVKATNIVNPEYSSILNKMATLEETNYQDEPFTFSEFSILQLFLEKIGEEQLTKKIAASKPLVFLKHIELHNQNSSEFIDFIVSIGEHYQANNGTLTIGDILDQNKSIQTFLTQNINIKQISLMPTESYRRNYSEKITAPSTNTYFKKATYENNLMQLVEEINNIYYDFIKNQTEKKSKIQTNSLLDYTRNIEELNNSDHLFILDEIFYIFDEIIEKYDVLIFNETVENKNSFYSALSSLLQVAILILIIRVEEKKEITNSFNIKNRNENLFNGQYLINFTSYRSTYLSLIDYFICNKINKNLHQKLIFLDLPNINTQFIVDEYHHLPQIANLFSPYVECETREGKVKFSIKSREIVVNLTLSSASEKSRYSINQHENKIVLATQIIPSAITSYANSNVVCEHILREYEKQTKHNIGYYAADHEWELLRAYNKLLSPKELNKLLLLFYIVSMAEQFLNLERRTILGKLIHEECEGVFPISFSYQYTIFNNHLLDDDYLSKIPNKIEFFHGAALILLLSFQHILIYFKYIKIDTENIKGKPALSINMIRIATKGNAYLMIQFWQALFTQPNKIKWSPELEKEFNNAEEITSLLSNPSFIANITSTINDFLSKPSFSGKTICDLKDKIAPEFEKNYERSMKLFYLFLATYLSKKFDYLSKIQKNEEKILLEMSKYFLHMAEIFSGNARAKLSIIADFSYEFLKFLDRDTEFFNSHSHKLPFVDINKIQAKDFSFFSEVVCNPTESIILQDMRFRQNPE